MSFVPTLFIVNFI